MLHKTLETKTTTMTDLGEFEAIAAAYSVDRVKDRIHKGAFAKTIGAWQTSGKNLPLHWDHEGGPHNVIGYVEPASMQEVEEGLYVKGKLDLDKSEIAKEAWRSMKNNVAALSFGYLAQGVKGADGVNNLTEIDLYEISVTPHPVNVDTRFLSLKSANADTEEFEPIDPKELRKRTFDAALENAKEGRPARKTVTPDEPVQDEDEPTEESEVQVDETKIITQVSEVEDGRDEELLEAKSAPQDPLRKRTYEVALGISNGGMKVRKHIEPDPEPEPLDAVELRRRTDRLRLDIASG